MFYPTVSSFFETEGDFSENRACGLCDGDHDHRDCPAVVTIQSSERAAEQEA